MAEAVRSAELQGLPDAGDAEGLARVQCGVEVGTLDGLEGGDVFFRRIAGFLTSQIESDHAAVPEGNGQFRPLQGIRQVPHPAQDQTPPHAVFFLTAIEAINGGLHHRFRRQSPLQMETGRKAALGINHAIVEHILDKFKGHALDGGPRLHHPAGVAEAFQILR